MKPAIVIKNLTVAYQHHRILHNLDFTAEVGTLIAIMGPNGSGKSNLIESLLFIFGRRARDMRLK